MAPLRRPSHGPALAAAIGAIATVFAVAASGASAAAVPLAISGSPSAPVEAGDAVDGASERAAFGVQPANAAGGLDERAFFQYGLPAQASVFDYAAFVNYGDIPLTLSVYATDAFTAETGGFAPLPGSEAPSDAGTWITVGESTTVDVPPADASGPGTVVVPVTITVPENATPGDHAAAILVVLTTLGENPEGQNVQLEQRVGSRVYLRIDGELAPGLTVSDIAGTYRRGSLPWQPGSLEMSYTVTNSGNVRMGVEPSATVIGPFGLNERRGSAETIGELLPRGSVEVRQVVDGVWPLVRLDTAVRLEAVAAPGTEAPDLGPTTAESVIWVVPWQALLILLMLAIVIAVLTAIRRGRRRKKPTTDPARPASPAGDTAVRVPAGAGLNDGDPR